MPLERYSASVGIVSNSSPASGRHPAVDLNPCGKKTMCIRKLYIFLGCGHSIFHPRPLLYCAGHDSGGECKPMSHPFRTINLDGALCRDCERSRQERLLEAARGLQIITFDEQKWRVRFDEGDAARPGSSTSASSPSMEDERPMKLESDRKSGEQNTVQESLRRVGVEPMAAA